MGKRAEKPEKIEAEAAKPEASNPAAGDTTSSPATDRALPIVESPKLDGSEPAEPAPAEPISAEPVSEPLAPEIAAAIAKSDSGAAHDAPGEATTETVAATPRSWRFALLAATIALVAAIGSFAGSLTASGVGGLTSVPAGPSASTVDLSGVVKALKSELAELNAIKSSLDNATHYANAQFASISDRLEHVEHAQTDPAQLAHIADTLDRLNKLNTSTPETTGTIASVAPGAVAPVEPKITDRILEDWVVQDVHGDRALVASRYGGIFDVGAGSVLPGIGRVDAVKRQDGQWIVVTARGLIMSAR